MNSCLALLLLIRGLSMSEVKIEWSKEGRILKSKIDSFDIHPKVFLEGRLGWNLINRELFIQNTINSIANLEIGSSEYKAEMNNLEKVMVGPKDEYFWFNEPSGKSVYESEDPFLFNEICQKALILNEILVKEGFKYHQYENDVVQHYAKKNASKLSGETVKKNFVFSAHSRIEYEYSEVIEVPVEASHDDLMEIHSEIEEDLDGCKYEDTQMGGWDRDGGYVMDIAE